MPVIIKVGSTAIEIFWAMIVLLGVLLTSYGFFSAINGVTDFGIITLTNTAALSRIIGGIVILMVGLVVVAAGALGVRGRIIITSEE